MEAPVVPVEIVEIPVEKRITKDSTKAEILEFVKETKNPSLVASIIFCESGFKPLAVNSPYEGSKTTRLGYDYSLFQINSYYHESEMTKQGLNFKDPHDSFLYGLSMLEKSTSPWSASMHCWKPLYSKGFLGS